MKSKAGRLTVDVGIIVSVPVEGSLIAAYLKHDRSARSRIYRGRIAGRSVVLSVSGIGKVNAAHATSHLICQYEPKLVLNIGVGERIPHPA